jgi:hypothetical protein
VADLDKGGQVGHDALDPDSAEEAHQVQPVRPDVADGPEHPALGGIEPPVPVGVEQEPVLEVVAGDQADLAQLAVGHESGEVLVQGIEADVEVTADHAGLGGQADRLPIRREVASGFSQRRASGRDDAHLRWSVGDVTWTTSTARRQHRLHGP